MSERFLIDGNNLLHAMRAHAPVPTVGRETMVRHVERWARTVECSVELFLDGPVPRGPLATQMASAHIRVIFSENRTADDLIVDAFDRCPDPGRLRLVSADTALVYEANRRGSSVTTPLEFIADMFPRKTAAAKPQPVREKPEAVSPEESARLADMLGNLADDLFDNPENR